MNNSYPEDKIPYEDASKLYKIVNYRSLSKGITRVTALRLIREHDCSMNWTTSMYSWLVSVLVKPYVSKEEITGKEGDTETKHVLYWYPELMTMFRAHRTANPTSKLYNLPEEFKQEFPGVFQEYTLTLAERVLFQADRGAIYDESEHNTELSNYLFKSLIVVPIRVKLTTENLKQIYEIVLSIYYSGLSEEIVQEYLEENWSHLFYRIYQEFLSKMWTPSELELIAKILNISDEFRYQAKLIRKYQDYARIASSKQVMCYLLNLPMGVYPNKKVLHEKLWSIVSDLLAYRERLILHNKKKIAKYIKDIGFPVKNKIPEKIYEYPSSELVFSLQGETLRCYTRMNDIDSNDNKGVYLQLRLISEFSPLRRKVLKDINLNILELFHYFSLPYYYEDKMDAVFVRAKSKHGRSIWHNLVSILLEDEMLDKDR